jgi:multimeric flavodoxin WrbA
VSNEKKVIGLVGSPNKDGLTNRLIGRALEGAAKAGEATELIQMSDYVVNACRDCLPPVCDRNLKCTFDDKNFEVISNKILGCKALILGTPVYLGGTSAMVRLLITKMVRVFAMSGSLQGLPALGIAIAGETGNGLLSGLRPLYHFFRIMRFRAIDPLPVTRFNLANAERVAEESGCKIAEMSKSSRPFGSSEECQLWYDSLPYLVGNNNSERRLLAAITIEAVPKDRKAEINGSLATADILAASGKTLESMVEISKVYNSCVEIIGRE